MTYISDLQGVPNFRGVGGLPLINGGKTKSGILYRSAALNSVTKDGLEELAESNIGVIADLRTDQERQFQPDKLPASRKIEEVDLPIAAGSLSPEALAHFLPGSGSGAQMSTEELTKEIEEKVPTVGHMYLQMLSQGAKEFAKVAKLTAQVDPEKSNSVLVHCTAGKDRTGIACALILSVAGAERQAIIENYSLSQKLLAGPWANGMLKNIKQAGIPMVPALVNIVTTTPPSAMEEALNWVDKNHGNAAEYLKTGGLDESEIEQIRHLLS